MCFQLPVLIIINFMCASVVLHIIFYVLKIAILESYASIFSIILLLKIQNSFLPDDGNLFR